MLSKLVQQNRLSLMVNNASRAFRASSVANRKPSIGDAVTILQSKVSSINQVVSYQNLQSCRVEYLTLFSNRTTSRNSELSSLLEMVLPEFSDS